MITLNMDKFPVMTSGSVRLLAMGLAGQCRSLIMASELAQKDNDKANTIRANEMLEDHDNLVRSVHMLVNGVYGLEVGELFSEIYSCLADEAIFVEPDITSVNGKDTKPDAPIAVVTAESTTPNLDRAGVENDR